MRLLIVSLSNRRRGSEVHAHELAGALRRSGFQVDQIALVEYPDPRSCLDIETLGRTWRSPVTLYRLRRRAKLADLVVAFGSFTLPACVIALVGTGTPVVYHEIGDPLDRNRGRTRAARRGNLLRRVQGIVVMWQGAAQSLSDLFGVPRERITVIPNARSADDFPLVTEQARSMAREEFGFASTDRVVAIVGALGNVKRVDRAIRVIAEDPTLHLLVAGEGSLRSDLEDLANRLTPGRVKFLGSVTPVRYVYAAADCLILTSRSEGMPGVAIEAGLSGIPVVAASVGGVATVIGDPSMGRLVGDDIVSYVKAIQEVLEEKSVPNISARDWCRLHFDWDTVTNPWVELVTNLVHQNSG